MFLEKNKLVKRLLYIGNLNVNKTSYPGMMSQMTEIAQE